MYGTSIQLKITEMTKPSKKLMEITQLNQLTLDHHTDQVHKLLIPKIPQVILNHLMIKKSKLPLNLKDQHGSQLTLMIFSWDQFIITMPQETGFQREVPKPLPKKPSLLTNILRVQDFQSISTNTSKKHGDISMLTELERLKPSRPHNLLDSLLQTKDWALVKTDSEKINIELKIFKFKKHKLF